jgi:hypothetical protein
MQEQSSTVIPVRACTGCGQVFAATTDNFYRNNQTRDGLTQQCKACKRAVTKEWRARNPEYAPAYLREYRHRVLADGMTVDRRRHVRLRAKVLRHYGGDPPHCACCGEATDEFLCLDHINGNGAAHRRAVGTKNMYRWANQHGFPDGFQVLCHNCNCAKGFYGICPHQRTRPQP